MRKKRFLTSAIIALVLTSALAAQGEEARNSWSVKIFGGGWFGRNGDIRTFLQEYDRYFQQWAEAYGADHSGSLDWPGAGVAFGGEIARMFSSRIGAGLAVERLSKSSSGNLEVGSGTDRIDMNLTALSVTAFGRYAVPLSKAASIDLKAGAGVLFGSLDQTVDSRISDGGGVLVNGNFDAAGFVGQTTLGLEWKLSPWFALSLEGGYRLASLSNWSGEDVHDWGTGSAAHSGALYYVEMQMDTERIPSVYYPSLILGDPTLGTRVVAYRRFKADFSGFHFQAGLVFRFGR